MTDRPIEPAALVDRLREWLPQQRWYGAKAAIPSAVEIVSYELMHAGEPALHHLLVRAGADCYQLFLGTRRGPLPAALHHVEIGVLDERWVYDALHDSELAGALLGALRPLPGAVVPQDLPSLVMSVEQSNTSVIFGEELVLKVFRRLAPGINPDLEVTSALAAAGCKRIARPIAFFETAVDGEPTTGAVLAEFLRTAVDGWELARTSIRDLFAEADLHADEVGGDFAGESYRLGQAVAEVHGDLARALPTGAVSADELQTRAAQMRARLDAAAGDVPVLAPYVEALAPAYDALAGVGAVHAQRIHGDLHLGQVLRTELGWFLVDFEGEPASSLAERRALGSPLKDVAGMLRSFDYAARHLLVESEGVGGPHLEYRADEWAARNQAAFCDGYTEVQGGDPRDDAALLRAFEIDKIVYEVLYEAHNRPTWLPIPMSAVRRLATLG